MADAQHGRLDSRALWVCVAGVLLLAVLAFLASGELDAPPPREGAGAARADAPPLLGVAAPPASDEAEARGTPAVGATWTVRVKVVVGYENRVIEDADVRAVGSDGQARRARTGEDGIATFPDMPAGPVRAVARAEGHAVSEEETTDLWEPLDEILIRLDPAAPLHGRVVDAADGRPIAEATVTALAAGALCISPRPRQTVGREFGHEVTASDGRFVIRGVAREPACALRLVRAEAAGYRTLWKIAPPDGEDGHFVIRMVPGGVLEGTVTAPGGRPVAGARVVALLSRDWLDHPCREVERVDFPDRFFDRMRWMDQRASAHVAEDAFAALITFADDEGRYVLSGLGLGERYAVGADRPGHAPSKERDVKLKSATARVRVDLALEAACKLTVRCVDRDGQPWPELWVRVDRDVDGVGEELADAHTDAQGLARFDTLTPGAYLVWARNPEGKDPLLEVEGRAGNQALTLQLDAVRPPPPEDSKPAADSQDGPDLPLFDKPDDPPTLLARLAVPEGVTPPEYVDLSGLFPGGGGYGGTAWTPDASGTVLVEWTWDNLAYAFHIEAHGFRPIVRQVQRAPGVVADLGTLVLDPGKTLRGRVRLPDGTPLSGATLKVTHPARENAVDRVTLFALGGPDDEYTRDCVTAADGSFALSGWPPEAVSIELRDPRILVYFAQLPPLPHEKPVEVVVDPGRLLRVHAVDEDGLPATLRRVRITRGPEEDGKSVAHGRTDVEGTFTARLASGVYRVALAGRSGTAWETRVVKLSAEREPRAVRLTSPEQR